MGVTFEVKNDRTQEVLSDFKQQIRKGLEAIGEVAVTHAKEGCPVDTGRLRNSISHAVPDDKSCYIGTNVEYAIYVETITRYSHATGGPHFIKNAAANHTDEYKAILQAALQA